MSFNSAWKQLISQCSDENNLSDFYCGSSPKKKEENLQQEHHGAGSSSNPSAARAKRSSQRHARRPGAKCMEKEGAGVEAVFTGSLLKNTGPRCRRLTLDSSPFGEARIRRSLFGSCEANAF